MVRAGWCVAPGSGTGEPRGLRGEGGYVWDGDGHTTRFTFDYDFDAEAPRAESGAAA